MKLTACPLCGATRMRAVSGPYAVEANGKKIDVPRVKRQKCLSCKEEFFDHEPNAVLDAYRQVRAKHRVAA